MNIPSGACHEVGFFRGLFASGWVRTKCGMEVLAGNGPVSGPGVSVTCPACARGVRWDHHSRTENREPRRS